ncbi:FAD/NAD(P)-binding protein [Candidatus Pelagibacter sp. Uisw_136]|uniref:FAD/NAD(P)-binding protein n=1 Tax=Candidatus Pelagibacter sp. Uisw_136 TaxID=3230991 RepID=UPI0039ECDC8F
MFTYDLVIIGFGVIGTEALYALHKLNYNKAKKLKIAIIDRDVKNIPGGVAYSTDKSMYGFFNNPLRLSHQNFIEWIKKPINFSKCCNFFENNKSYNLSNWVIQNKNLISNKKFLEIYFPRFFYSIYLKDKIFEIIDSKQSNLKIDLLIGSADQLIENKTTIIESNSFFHKYSFIKKNNELKFIRKNHKLKKIITKKIILGVGLLPPKIIKTNFKKNDNYIWDFYATGGTKNLIKKIDKIKNYKDNVNLIFIGNKAGFLETMQKLEQLINFQGKNIHIHCIAPRIDGLQKAILSKNYSKYKFKYLLTNKINNIKSSNEILSLIKKEFNFSKKNGYYRYDIWTLILKKKILIKCYAQLSSKQKLIYNSKIFSKIRNITRYTYPETVNAKEKLEKAKKINFINDKVLFIKQTKEKMQVITNKNKIYSADIVTNVSGPVNILEVHEESSLISSLKKITHKYDKSGFFADKNFKVNKNIFIPGVISNNFNPTRQTIIKAITNNVSKVIKKLFKEF